MQYHPDKNDSPDAGERFMKVNQAYQVLSDPERKQQYDRFGTIDEQQSIINPYQQYGGHFDDFVGSFHLTRSHR